MLNPVVVAEENDKLLVNIHSTARTIIGISIKNVLYVTLLLLIGRSILEFLGNMLEL